MQNNMHIVESNIGAHQSEMGEVICWKAPE